MSDNSPIEEILGWNPNDPRARKDRPIHIGIPEKDVPSPEIQDAFSEFANKVRFQNAAGRLSVEFLRSPKNKYIYPEHMSIVATDERGDNISRIYYLPNLKPTIEKRKLHPEIELNYPDTFVPISQLGITLDVSPLPPDSPAYVPPKFRAIRIIHGERAESSVLENEFSFRPFDDVDEESARLLTSYVWAPIIASSQIEAERKLQAGYSPDGQLTDIRLYRSYHEGVRIHDYDLEKAKTDGTVVIQGENAQGSLSRRGNDTYTLDLAVDGKTTDTATFSAKIEPDFVIDNIGLREFIKTSDPSTLPPETDTQWRHSDILREFQIEWKTSN